jgi:hypothetical protein
MVSVYLVFKIQFYGGVVNNILYRQRFKPAHLWCVLFKIVTGTAPLEMYAERPPGIHLQGCN